MSAKPEPEAKAPPPETTDGLLKSFLIELVVYGLLVVGYYFSVLYFLGSWLGELFHHQRQVYAAVALALMVGQAVLLDAVTHLLLALIRPRRKA
jgi:hypothetical protein